MRSRHPIRSPTAVSLVPLCGGGGECSRHAVTGQWNAAELGTSPVAATNEPQAFREAGSPPPLAFDGLQLAALMTAKEYVTMARRRGILRTAGRTAVIAGTATAVSGRVANRQRRTFAEPAAVTPQPPAAAAAAIPGSDLVGRLQQLVALKEGGALTNQEFVAAKTKLLQG
jgi:hypothetical protein